MKENVQRGAALLDKENPTWANQIDIEHLDLSWCEDCILGQLYGRYSVGLDLFCPGWFGSVQSDWAKEHGFYPKRGGFEHLQDLWLEENHQTQGKGTYPMKTKYPVGAAWEFTAPEGIGIASGSSGKIWLKWREDNGTELWEWNWHYSDGSGYKEGLVFSQRKAVEQCKLEFFSSRIYTNGLVVKVRFKRVFQK